MRCFRLASLFSCLTLGMAGLAACATDNTPRVASMSEDDELRSDIVKTWQQDYPELVNRISVSVSQSIVTLNGIVMTPQMSIDALRSTWSHDSVHEVVNEIQIMNGKGVNYFKDNLAMKLRGKLIFDSNIDSTHYSVESIKDTVYIMGVAESEAEKDRVEAVAYATKGVNKVVDYIRIKSAS